MCTEKKDMNKLPLRISMKRKPEDLGIQTVMETNWYTSVQIKKSSRTVRNG